MMIDYKEWYFLRRDLRGHIGSRAEIMIKLRLDAGWDAGSVYFEGETECHPFYRKLDYLKYELKVIYRVQDDIVRSCIVTCSDRTNHEPESYEAWESEFSDVLKKEIGLDIRKWINPDKTGFSDEYEGYFLNPCQRLFKNQSTSQWEIDKCPPQGYEKCTVISQQNLYHPIVLNSRTQDMIALSEIVKMDGVLDESEPNYITKTSAYTTLNTISTLPVQQLAKQPSKAIDKPQEKEIGTLNWRLIQILIITVFVLTIFLAFKTCGGYNAENSFRYDH